MNLLSYTLNYAPEPIGTGKYSGEMAAWLAARGHTVEVICGLPHYPQWKLDEAHKDGRSCEEQLDGVWVRRTAHYVPSPDSLGALARIRLETSFTLRATRYWLPKLFARSKPDVVIAVMPPLQIGGWPLIYALLRRVPWVLHIQDLQVDAALRLKMLPGGLIGKILYKIESFLLRRATRVSSITQAMCDRVIAKGVAKEHAWLFPNWSGVGSAREAGQDNAFRKALNLEANTLLVLYAGNMGEKQGLDNVLEAAAGLQKDKNIQFLMVGAGAARARLEQRAQEMSLENVRFMSVQPLEKLPEMLAAGDIHLVVQKRNAADLVMPSKLTNILAAGRPSVVTADPETALGEVVAQYGIGLATPPEDSAALAEAISTLATDVALRARCAEAARAYAQHHLDRDSILSAFEDKLLALTGKNRHE